MHRSVISAANKVAIGRVIARKHRREERAQRLWQTALVDWRFLGRRDLIEESDLVGRETGRNFSSQ